MPDSTLQVYMQLIPWSTAEMCKVYWNRETEKAQIIVEDIQEWCHTCGWLVETVLGIFSSG